MSEITPQINHVENKSSVKGMRERVEGLKGKVVGDILSSGVLLGGSIMLQYTANNIWNLAAELDNPVLTFGGDVASLVFKGVGLAVGMFGIYRAGEGAVHGVQAIIAEESVESMKQRKVKKRNPNV